MESMGLRRLLDLLMGLLVLVAGLAYAVHARELRSAAGRAFVLRVASAPLMALEPIREAVQTDPTLPPDAVLADLPGGYPVIAATRPMPVWRAVRLEGGE